MDYLAVPESAREGWRLWQVAHNDADGSSSPMGKYPSPKDDRVTLHANAVAAIAEQIKIASYESVFSQVKQFVLPDWFTSLANSSNASCNVGLTKAWTHLHLQNPSDTKIIFQTGNSDGGHQSDLDVVVASPAGVLVIEVKTWQGTVHASSCTDKAKTQTNKNEPINANDWVEIEETREPWMLIQSDGVQLPRKNPVAQVMAKARALREYLVGGGVVPKSCLVQGLVVFSNESCTLSAQVKKMDHVIDASGLATLMNILKYEGLGPIVLNPRVLQCKSTLVLSSIYFVIEAHSL
jgi:hypothetical protein